MPESARSGNGTRAAEGDGEDEVHSHRGCAHNPGDGEGEVDSGADDAREDIRDEDEDEKDEHSDTEVEANSERSDDGESARRWCRPLATATGDEGQCRLMADLVSGGA